MKNLTKKELQEDVFKSLGRLKVAISQDKERALQLFEKVREDVSRMDIKIMHLERDQVETINVGDEDHNLEVEISDHILKPGDEIPF